MDRNLIRLSPTPLHVHWQLQLLINYIYLQNLPGSKPIAIKSQRFSFSDRTFIQEEITRLIKEYIIQHSTSP